MPHPRRQRSIWTKIKFSENIYNLFLLTRSINSLKNLTSIYTGLHSISCALLRKALAHRSDSFRSLSSLWEVFLSNLRSKESNILCHPLFFLHLFFIKLSFPLYSQKYFSCPTTPPQPVSLPHLNPIFFFFFPSLFQKNSPPFPLF